MKQALVSILILTMGLLFAWSGGDSMAQGKEAMNDHTKLKTVVFAGGCFWCTEYAFDQVEGVVSTISGYTGGAGEKPSYEEVSSGRTGHKEALQVVYNPAQVSYKILLEIYWKSIDPTDKGGQFADRGSQYQTAIFYADEEERSIADASKKEKAKELGVEVATEILPLSTFYPAEEYHQDYHSKNPTRYKMYHFGSGRPARLKDIWGDKE